MSDEAIKVGDVVRVKSGGPQMTVIRIINKTHVCVGTNVEPYAHCLWFDQDSNRTNCSGQNDFPVVALEKVEISA